MVRDISRDELKDMMDRGDEFVLVNVLDHESFEDEHICGSINIPVKKIQDATDLINRNETVVVHCSGPGCKASEFAADELDRLGFTDVRRFEGGIEEWKDAGYCIEGSMYRAYAA